MIFDTHIHLLPRLDNGPANIAESMKMLRMMVDGHICGAVVATHYDFESTHPVAYFDARQRQIDALRQRMKQNRIRLRLLFAPEVDYCNSLFRNVSMKPFTIPRTRYVMINLPNGEFGDEKMRDFAALIQKQKLIPIVCNMERHIVMNVENAAARIAGISNAVFQIGARSLLFREVGEFVMKWRRRGGRFLIASNGHDTGARCPIYLPGELNIERQYGVLAYRYLYRNNLEFRSELFPRVKFPTNDTAFSDT